MNSVQSPPVTAQLLGSGPTADDLRLFERTSLIDRDAERICNSAMLNSEEALLELKGLPPTYFVDDKQRMIFMALKEMANKNVPLTNVAVSNECRRLAAALKFQNSVTPVDVNDVRMSSWREWEKVGEHMRNLARNRGHMKILSDCISKIDSSTNPAQTEAYIREQLTFVMPPEENANELDGSMMADYQAKQLDKRQKEYREGKTNVIVWPWASWRRNIANHKPGKFLSILVPDGDGKSTVMQNLMEHMAKDRFVFYMALEDPYSNIVDRMCARHTGILLENIEIGNYDDEQKRRLNAAMASISTKMKMFDMPGAAAPDINNKLEIEMSYRKKYDPDFKAVLIIDYIHAMSPSRYAMRSNGRSDDALKQDINALVAMSGKEKVPYIVAGQVTKAYVQADDERKRELGRTGGYGSVALSWASAAIVNMHQNDVPARDGSIELKYTVTKSNDKGKGGSFKQRLVGSRFLVEDYPEGAGSFQ